MRTAVAPVTAKKCRRNSELYVVAIFKFTVLVFFFSCDRLFDFDPMAWVVWANTQFATVRVTQADPGPILIVRD